MRSRHIALGCALAGALGFLALPGAAARAASTVTAGSTAPAAPTRSAGAADAAAAAKARPRLSIVSSATTDVYASRVILTITLGRTYANRTVSIYAAPVHLKRWLWHSGKVNSAGTLRVLFRLTRTTTFTVVFGGDARDAPARASSTVDVMARAADRLTGYYKKTTVSGITYYVFHARAMLVLHATVSPNKHGECLRPETEQWDKGPGWDDDTGYGCDSLDSESHDSAPFNLAQAPGDKYRIRADYVRSAKDLANLNADGPWLYIMVVK
jgi:hypothetical protein